MMIVDHDDNNDVADMSPQKVWMAEKLFFHSDNYFEELLLAIDSAQKSIELETYIYAPDAIGRQLEKHLGRAAQRGVEVRLLVDGIGALGWLAGGLRSELKHSGVEIRIWNPFYVGPLVFQVLRAIRRRREFVRLLLHLNRRTHRKFCVIDGKLAFVGSQNIDRNHLQKLSGQQAWRDTGILLQGEEVTVLQNAFWHSWDRSYSLQGHRRWVGRRKIGRLTTDSLVRLNATIRNRLLFQHDLQKRIEEAQNRVWITNPYLSPTLSFIKSLIKCRRSGAEVLLLAPAQNDIFFMRWIASIYYEMLLEHGVRVFEYQPRFLHAKSMIIDDWAIVGTSNLNTRSFLYDLEVDIVLTHSHSKTELEKQFKIDLSHSRELIFNTWKNQNRWAVRLGHFFLFLLRPFI